MPFEIVRNDIVNMQVDAVVNTANPEPVIGTGVDSAIHKKAGRELLAARKKIGCIDFGGNFCSERRSEIYVRERGVLRIKAKSVQLNMKGHFLYRNTIQIPKSMI